MLKLGGRTLGLHGHTQQTRIVLKLSEDADLSLALRSQRAYLVRSELVPAGFAAYVILPGGPALECFSDATTIVQVSEEFQYLRSGDIVRIDFHERSIRTLFRANSRQNFFLVTEQCNSYCLMCSQPPKQIDDSWILDETRQVIALVSPETPEIGFTGGEPFLFGDSFLDLLKLAKNLLPRTAVHILSNGRLFSDRRLAKRYASIQHPDMMIGIPLYSDDATIHDYVVQARGAFDETILGILNLKEFGQRVEIRVVLHRQTVDRLPQLAEFISRNLLFVDQVALMGLEITGFTRANLDEVWIDPKDYADQLRKAVRIFEAYRIPVSIYNHQLCTVDKSLWHHCRKSISDWKNEYLDVCNTCSVKSECGGFFSSSKQYKHSEHIRPI
jgi:His-Xaa-Ser system radical SAM maturase HxsC